MKNMLTAAVLAIMCSAALATPLDVYGVWECSGAKVTPPERNDNDPIYKITVRVGADLTDGNKDITVTHRSVMGVEYRRDEQYHMQNTQLSNSRATWRGLWMKDPSRAINGVLSVKSINHKNPPLGIYSETIYDTRKSRTIMTLVAKCNQVGGSDMNESGQD